MVSSDPCSSMTTHSKIIFIKLYKCNFVTEIGINVLLAESNPLKKIEILTERSWTREKEDWNNKIALNNWQLEIEVDKIRTPEEIDASDVRAVVSMNCFGEI